MAAEKAAEWKRQQLEAENKRKEGKSYIKKKVVNQPQANAETGDDGLIEFSRL